MTLEQLIGNNAITAEVPACCPQFLAVSSACFIYLSNAVAQSGCSKLHKYEANMKNVMSAVLVRAV
jgi:hypothetical protein